jgi:hypothetical protein
VAAEDLLPSTRGERAPAPGSPSASSMRGHVPASSAEDEAARAEHLAHRRDVRADDGS